MKKYVSKIVEVEAMQFDGENGAEIEKITNRAAVVVGNCLYIKTLEGTMSVSKGDFVIRGTEGEYYPCKPSVFERKYIESVNE